MPPNQKRYSPMHGNGPAVVNIASAANIPVASILAKQPVDTSGSVRMDSTTPPTVAVASGSPDPNATLPIPSGITTSTSTSTASDSTATSTSIGTVITQATSTTTLSSQVVKKSTLNPNAKEFVLNPGAKSFVPAATAIHRPPTALTPQRPISAGPPAGQPPQAVYAPVPFQNTANFSGVQHPQIPQQQFIGNTVIEI